MAEQKRGRKNPRLFYNKVTQIGGYRRAQISLPH